MSTGTLKDEIIQRAAQDPELKQRLVEDPQGVLRQTFGVEIPSEIEFKVIAESNSSFFLVIPPKPEDTDDLKDSPMMYTWS